MKERTKEIVKDGFGSLINNSACIRGAKNGPLWLTIIMFVLSLLLPIVPIITSQAQISGSSFIKSYSYGLEKQVTSMAMKLKDDNVKFTIGQDHLLSITKDGNEINYETYDKPSETVNEKGKTVKTRIVEPFATYKNSVTGQYDFVLYVSSATTTSDRNLFNNVVKVKTYAIGSTNAPTDADTVYTPSYMILFKNALKVSIFGANTTTNVALSYLGDYKTMKVGAEGVSYLLDVKDKEGNAIAQSLTDNAYTDGVLKNFKKIMNKSYDTLKIKNVWGTSGIYLGIFAGLNLMMGLLMWVLTRGKKNPNNYFSIWLTMKIQGRLGLAPALLAMIAGFFLPNYVYIIYIMLVGLRVMWMSMKELRPIQQ